MAIWLVLVATLNGCSTTLQSTPTPDSTVGALVATEVARQVQGTVTAIRSEQAATATSVPARTVTPIPVIVGTAVGQIVPAGQLPPATPTPRLIFFRRDPYGPVKIDPGTAHQVQLGSLEPGTQVRAVVTVAFNNRLSNISGTPDIDIIVTGPAGAIANYPGARNGFQLAFQASTEGGFTIDLSNARSRVNAKQVGLQFLQP